MHLKYREEKATQAAAYLLHLAGGSMNYMKLIKVLYLAEREALVRWGRPITFDRYVAMRHGPVLSGTYDRITDQPDPAHPSYWNTLISPPNNYVVSLLEDPPPKEQLSEAEESLLGETFEKCRSMNEWQVRDLTHELPEWTDPEGSSVPISIRDILQSEGFDESDIEDIYEALQAEASAHEMLG
jgi:uncharacterized phage-associated protein